jgi:hypothetical protein
MQLLMALVIMLDNLLMDARKKQMIGATYFFTPRSP